MIEPNWNIFKVKFNGRENDVFEWFSYLLFCKEFNRPFGIQGFFNQSGMETNPIKCGDDYIAWESKFYETKLSDHETDFKDKITKAKDKNPKITKMLFYTHLNWTESSLKTKQKTNPQENIEKFAAEQNIQVVWKGENFFKSLFVIEQHKDISSYFFVMDNTIFDLVKRLEIHTENILQGINDSIVFQGSDIKIDRQFLVDRLHDDKEKNFFIQGAGGIGKTSIIKNLYKTFNRSIPFFIFKADELNTHISHYLFKYHTIEKFIDLFTEEEEKIIVIDSAERLLDIDDVERIERILCSLKNNNWKIIFTIREYCLNNLYGKFPALTQINFQTIDVPLLTNDELLKISKKYAFVLPAEDKLLKLLSNLFYLNEYLQFYDVETKLSYSEFKDMLWSKVVEKGNVSRGQYFIEMIFQKVQDGRFFIEADTKYSGLENEFKKENLFGYDKNGGYFVVHDIYEEWALERKIDRCCANKKNIADFFTSLGTTLSIRRSFRNWLLEKDEVSVDKMDFVKNSLKDTGVSQDWKDEILVSVLLSDLSEEFFKQFKDKVLDNNCELLKKNIFLLQVACKELDVELYSKFRKFKDLAIVDFFIKPRGLGWDSLIKFCWDNLDAISYENIPEVLPVLHSWNKKVKEGETTEYASKIALAYYEHMLEDRIWQYSKDEINETIEVVLWGASEIKEDLIHILDKVLENNWNKSQDPYFDLMHAILKNVNQSYGLYKVLPAYVLKIANLFWRDIDIDASLSRYNVEKDFAIVDKYRMDYYPASSYQTPIYWLLQFDFKGTIDFLLQFINESMEYLGTLQNGLYVEKVQVYINDTEIVTQYISDHIWCMYRDSQHPNPCLLASIHMALERYLLEIGKYDSVDLNLILLYLLRNSKSSSITALVVSIMLAFPEKTFDVAKIIFKTKEFFLYDYNRWQLDNHMKMVGIVALPGIHKDERIDSLGKEHRYKSLEHICCLYSWVKAESLSDEIFKERQRVIYNILDDFYKALPKPADESDGDKIWRLYLARMDTRRMEPSLETFQGEKVIKLNPTISPTLKAYSDESLKKIQTSSKYSELLVWIVAKIEHKENTVKCESYENDPKKALKDAVEIAKQIKVNTMLSNDYEQDTEQGRFDVYYSKIPVCVAAVLVQYYWDILDKDEKLYCKTTILDNINSWLDVRQFAPIASDHKVVKFVLLSLFSLWEVYPDEKADFKIIVLFLLLNDCLFDFDLVATNIFYIISSHNDLWNENFDDMQAILYGYLLLKPKHIEMRREAHNKFSIKDFKEANKESLENIKNNNLLLKDLGEIEEIDFPILMNSFLFIPRRTKVPEYIALVNKIIAAFIGQIILPPQLKRNHITCDRIFLAGFARFVLYSEENEIKQFIKPFVDNICSREEYAVLFEQFVLAAHELKIRKEFWIVWTLFKDKICELGKVSSHYRLNEIIRNYLFALSSFNEASTFYGFEDSDKAFFDDIVERIGHLPIVLYSVVKILNDIGDVYFSKGLVWLVDILKNDIEIANFDFKQAIIFYLEKYVDSYIKNNQDAIKRNRETKDNVIYILDYLVGQKSTNAYTLRDNIL